MAHWRERGGERERESLGLAGYVDERECTHYCALAPDNVPGPSCWGSTKRDICGDAGVAFECNVNSTSRVKVKQGAGPRRTKQ